MIVLSSNRFQQRQWMHVLMIIPVLSIVGCTGREEDIATKLKDVFPSEIIATHDTLAVDLDGRALEQIDKLGIGGKSVFLFNSQEAELLQMDRSFNPIRKLGQFGQGQGEFSQRILQLIVTEQFVIVIDSGNCKALFYNHDGRFATELVLDSLAFMRLSFIWDEQGSKLYHLDSTSLEEKSMYVISLAPFRGVFGRGYRRLQLDKTNPTISDMQFTILAGVGGNKLILVDNYIDETSDNTVSLQQYSLRDGALLKTSNLLNTQSIAHYRDIYEEAVRGANETSSRPLGLILHPFTYIWAVNEDMIICFKVDRSDGNILIETLTINLNTGTIQVIN